jgi:hypothetical protein
MDLHEAFDKWWNHPDTQALVWGKMFHTKENCQMAFEAGRKAEKEKPCARCGGDGEVPARPLDRLDSPGILPCPDCGGGDG